MQPIGSGSNLKEDKELSLFKKKKIKTLRREQNEDGTMKKATSKSVNKKMAKAKEKFFAEI